MLHLRHPVALLLICILVIMGVLRSFSVPAPRAADSPDDLFSAVRAEVYLRDLLQEGVPHVSGTAENRVIRDRLIDYLEGFGYAPEVQALFHCNANFGVCSPVENVIAVKAGSVGKGAVLLTAHYDGSWTGPGAADDGAGVAAILEIARMAVALPPFENDIIFLFSDSEENGLIGADAFANLHPLFKKVKSVINLEARGVTGPSAMFETGEGNRRLIRALANAVDRPVANSLTYEVYKRMPNDTDYSVYKGKGVLGLNFAFSQGVAVYHSTLDDPDHLDPGSLQHHGDNAWSMLNALGDRNLAGVGTKEDAGYIDLFATRLVHYPASIALGLALVLGVITLIAIALAYRKDFRLWALRWGLLAVPVLIASMVFGAYLVSFPLGVWADLHAIEHPQPWPGRVVLFLVVLLSIYLTVKLFSKRVSTCAMMGLAWGIVFVLAMVLAKKLPTAVHLMLIPLAMFSLGSMIDLLRKKSRAPLLMASVFGFAGAAFISFYHFFMLDAVLNFDQSHIRILTLVLVAITSLPLLLAWVGERELSWRPARWLLVAILAGCFIHLYLPGFTPERPRDMTLMYSEVQGADTGSLVVESIYRTPDMEYAEAHGFEMAALDTGWPEPVERPLRAVPLLGLAGLELSMSVEPEDVSWRWRIEVEVPEGVPLVQFIIDHENLPEKAWINGQLALDKSLQSKRRDAKRRDADDRLRVVSPEAGPLVIELLMGNPEPLKLSATTWHPMPSELMAPYLEDWPVNAQPFLYGPRAQKIQRFELEMP